MWGILVAAFCKRVVVLLAVILLGTGLTPALVVVV
jgi:hypothetical protein